MNSANPRSENQFEHNADQRADDSYGPSPEPQEAYRCESPAHHARVSPQDRTSILSVTESIACAVMFGIVSQE